MKIVTKLILGGGATVLGVVVLAILMASTLGEISGDVRILAENDLPATSHLLNLDRDAHQAQLALERYVAEDNTEHADIALATYELNLAEIQERFDRYQAVAVGADGEAAEADAFRAAREEWVTASQELIAMRDTGSTLSDEQLQTKIDEVETLFDAMLGHVHFIQSEVYAQRATSFGPTVVEKTEGAGRLLLPLALLVALTGVGAILYLARQLGKPLRDLTNAGRKLAQGTTEVDITHTAKDETGELADAFREIASYLGDAIEAATQVADGDLTTTVTLHSERDELGIALQSMIERLRAVVSGAAEVTRQVDEGSEMLAASSEESAKAASEVAVSINSVAEGATDQAVIAEGLGSAVAEIVTELEATTRAFEAVSAASSDAQGKAYDGVEKVGQAIAAMNRITGVFSDASETVTQLGEYSEKVEDIVELIRSIADQTNLLALNAAIEAARAGEMGRGFAVVASEVKSLAEESSQSTEQIAHIVAQMRDSIAGAIKTMSDGRGDVDSGSAMVNTAGSSFSAITEAVQVISTKVGQATESATRIQHAAAAIDSGSHQLIEITEAASAASAQVAASSEEAAATSEEIGATAQDLSTSAKQLRNAMDRFRL